jgi:hypothetical protein
MVALVFSFIFLLILSLRQSQCAYTFASRYFVIGYFRKHKRNFVNFPLAPKYQTPMMEDTKQELEALAYVYPDACKPQVKS